MSLAELMADVSLGLQQDGASIRLRSRERSLFGELLGRTMSSSGKLSAYDDDDDEDFY